MEFYLPKGSGYPKQIEGFMQHARILTRWFFALVSSDSVTCG